MSVLAAAHAQAAQWLVAPTARVATDYTENPRLLAEGGQSSAGIVGELSAALMRRTERSEVSLAPRLRSGRYRDDARIDSDDQILQAGFKYFAERSQWTASANYTRDTTLTSELGSTGLVQVNRRHESITLSGGPSFQVSEMTSLGAQLYWLDNRYADVAGTSLVDYEYRAPSLFATVHLTELSDLTVTAQAGELLVPAQDTRTRDGTLRLAWSYRPSPLWQLDLSAGPSYVESDFGADNGAVFSMDLRRSGQRWTYSTRAGRDLTPTGRGILTRRDQLVLGVDHRFTEHLNAAVSARWVRNHDLLPQAGATREEVDYGRVDLDLVWRIAEHWTVGMTLGAATLDSHSRSGAAENYRASLSIVWNGQQQSL